MLNKLLKYDLKYMLKNMSVFYILSIFFAIVCRIILFSILVTNKTTMIRIIYSICSGIMYAMIFNIIFNTVIRSWVSFDKSLYKDEAYLTHTLPVSKNDIYNSKFIQTLIFIFICFFIVLLSLFIAYYSKDNWQVVTGFFKDLTFNLNINVTFIIIMIIVLLFLEIFNLVQIGYLGIIIGNRNNNHKIAYSLLAGFLIYLLSQAFVVLCVYICGLFNSNIMTIFETSSTILDNEITYPLLIISVLIYLFIIVFIKTICKKVLNKGVNIE